MTVSTPALRHDTQTSTPPSWLNSRHWDLTFISLSVVLVIVPYLAYLGLTQLQPLLSPMAANFGTTVGDLSRNIVNGTIALLIGGPHMYATFTRTTLDADYRARHPRIVWTSLAIPVVVLSLAIINLQLLLTLFFFWASIHVLHQIVYITELYNHKRSDSTMTKLARGADYFVILTSLYPIAAHKISIGEFAIGLNNLSDTVATVLGFAGLSLGPWMVWMSGGLFATALVLWLGKTVWEYQQDTLNWPKTLFIGLTVTASFWVPILPNLDTAFQGMNLWHSLQYLALTYYLNTLRQQRGELENKPFLKRMSEDGSARRYYVFNIGLTVADVGLAVVFFFIMRWVFNTTFDFAFDRAYYMAVLSFLWIHYYHDHFLFTEPEVINA